MASSGCTLATSKRASESPRRSGSMQLPSGSTQHVTRMQSVRTPNATSWSGSMHLPAPNLSSVGSIRPGSVQFPPGQPPLCTTTSPVSQAALPPPLSPQEVLTRVAKLLDPPKPQVATRPQQKKHWAAGRPVRCLVALVVVVAVVAVGLTAMGDASPLKQERAVLTTQPPSLRPASDGSLIALAIVLVVAAGALLLCVRRAKNAASEKGYRKRDIDECSENTESTTDAPYLRLDGDATVDYADRTFHSNDWTHYGQYEDGHRNCNYFCVIA